MDETTHIPHPAWSYPAVIYELNVRQLTPEGTFAAAEGEIAFPLEGIQFPPQQMELYTHDKVRIFFFRFSAIPTCSSSFKALFFATMGRSPLMDAIYIM